MKKNTVFLKAAGKAAGLPALLLALGLAASVSLALAGCDTGGGEEEGGGNTLPSAEGANELSGKTYFDDSKKIVFSTTAGRATNGTFTVGHTIQNNDNEYELENGKYKYGDIKTGYYSWNETAKTVTISPEKIAERDNEGYGPLQTETEYRAEMQTWLNDLKEEWGEEFNEALVANTGFSSVAAYLDYLVAEGFKNVTYKYAFSADGKALFLDEPLPANKGANELTGKTFNGTTWDNNGNAVKDDSQTYVFTATGCTYTRTWGENNSQTTEYTYAYDDGGQKRVYLKRSTTDRDTSYTTQSTNTDSGYFGSVDAYNAAQVNRQYQLEEYEYYTTEKTLQMRN